MRVIQDVVYAERQGQPLALDLYLPSGSARATVLLAHGGGFFRGNRHAPRTPELAERICAEGLAVASVSYRLATPADVLPPQVRKAVKANRQRALDGGLTLARRLLGPAFEAARQDIGAAIGFLRSTSGQHGIASDRLAILGISAGGIAGLALGHPPAALPALPRPDAVLALGAACAHPWALHAAGPPCLMLHSVQDRIIAPSNAQQAQRAAMRANAPLVLLTCRRNGHNAPVLALLQDRDKDGVFYWDHMRALFRRAGITPSRAGA